MKLMTAKSASTCLGRNILWLAVSAFLLGPVQAEDTVTITLEADPPEGGTFIGDGEVPENSTNQVTAVANPAWRFDEWVDDGNTNAMREIVVATNNVAYTAKFSRVAVVLTAVADPEEGGTVTGGGIVDLDSTNTLVATANETWAFTEWNDGDTNRTREVVVAADDVAYTAHFERVQAVIGVVAEPEEGGEVSGAGTFAVGGTNTITATPADDTWQFLGWADTDTNLTREIVITDVDVIHTARFARVAAVISVTAEPVAGGTVTGGGTYPVGTNVALMALANETWSFVEWNDGNTNATRTVLVSSNDVAFTAFFRRDQARITVQANPAAGGTVAGGGLFAIGSEQTISAAANEGWDFIRWSDEVVTNPRAITVTSNDVTYTANFERILPYPSRDDLVENRRPLFAWSPVSEATWYRVWLSRNGETFLVEWVEGATEWTPPRNGLPGGSYQWWIQPWSRATGYGAWSAPASFRVPTRLPGPVDLIAPRGAREESTLEYLWTTDINATWYRLWVQQDATGRWHDRWYAFSGGEEVSTVVSNHPGGAMTWWVQSWGPDGYGPWSSAATFSTPDRSPAAPQLLQPIGAQTTARPVFQWGEAERAEWYRIYVQSGSTVLLDRWTQGTQWNLTDDLDPGPHIWWVGSWNEITGRTVWSSAANFSIPE